MTVPSAAPTVHAYGKAPNWLKTHTSSFPVTATRSVGRQAYTVGLIVPMAWSLQQAQAWQEEKLKPVTGSWGQPALAVEPRDGRFSSYYEMARQQKYLRGYIAGADKWYMNHRTEVEDILLDYLANYTEEARVKENPDDIDGLQPLSG